MADESVFGPQALIELIHARAADIVNIKLMKSGGLSNAIRMADIAALHGMPRRQARARIDEVLAQVGLAGFEDYPAGQLSAGQQRRVALARLWLSERPALWILDEPFTAIDKQGVRVLEQLFLAHADRGGMVVLTTHQDLTLMQGRLKTLSLTSLLQE